MSEKVVVEADAPAWAHAMARQVEQALARLQKRNRELEERVKALEEP